MEGPPLGPGGEDITWPDQVAPRGRKASSTRKIKPQTSNLKCPMCSLVHPLDPLSTLSYCISRIHLPELFNNTWPLPFRHTIIN